jgi:hypothetical protein
MLKSSSWCLQLQYYWDVLEQAQKKIYMVTGYFGDQVRSNKFFNALINLNHIKITNVNRRGKCHL